MIRLRCQVPCHHPRRLVLPLPLPFPLPALLSLLAAAAAGDYCIGVQKAVQVILRRTLFRDRLEGGRMVQLEYAAQEAGDGYKGRIELPLLGQVRV